MRLGLTLVAAIDLGEVGEFWNEHPFFAPIQALVLGTTWPTVIAQILARTGETEADKIVELANRIAGRPATP